MNALDAIRAEIADLRDEAAGLAARREQIKAEHAALTAQMLALSDERDALDARLPEIDRHADALARAEAVLSEQATPAPEPEPVPEPQEPVSVTTKPPAPTPSAQRIRDDLHDAARARLECAPKAPAGEAPAAPKPKAVAKIAPKRRPTSGLEVVPRASVSHEAPKPDGVMRLSEGLSPSIQRALPKMLKSQVWLERADLVAQILKDHDGACSSRLMAEEVSVYLECKLPTAQALVSRSLAVLLTQDRVAPTGQKVEDSSGKMNSPVWKLKD